MARNFTYVLDRVKQRFPRTDAELELILATDIFENFTRDICSRFPYWFLQYPPGYTLPADFPTDEADLISRTPVFGEWLDRGWLRVEPDKDRYLLSAPADLGDNFDQDAAYWTNVDSQMVDFVKEFAYNGSMARDLEVVGDSRYFTVAEFNEELQPRIVFWETGEIDGERVSWLRFNPTPKRYHIYAVQFRLKQPVDYDPGLAVPTGDFTNRMLEEYPEVLINAGMLMAAEYFNEEKAVLYYRSKLYGNPDDGRRSVRGKQNEGLIARMKRDSHRRNNQEAFTIPQFLGARAALGRDGVTRNRFPRRPGLYFQNF